MAQRYESPLALERMSANKCPECGHALPTHTSDTRFWIPRTCDLTPAGVKDRIARYENDLIEAKES